MAEIDTSETVSIREASLDDKEAVLDINRNVYDGHDYLPFYFEKFLKCHRSKNYVALVNNNVVGFCIATVVDDNSTYISRAARVRTDMAGKGVYKQLTEHIRKDLGARKETFCTSNENSALSKDSFKQMYQEILKRNVYIFEFFNQAYNATNEDSFQRLRKVDAKLFDSFICSRQINEYLFPDRRIVTFWVPHRVMTSNIPSVLWHESTMYSDLTVDKCGNICGLLTICTVYSCIQPQVMLHIDIYGSVLSSLKPHLMRHIRDLQENQTRKTIMYVYAEEKLTVRSIVENTLANLNLSDKSKHFVKEFKQYLFERN